MIEIKDSFWKDFLADIPGPSEAVPAYAAHARAGREFFSGIPESRALHRYAPGKWSVKEVLGHITDAHTVFLYRIVCISRGEEKPLPGFDENEYVRNFAGDGKPWSTLLESYLGISHAVAALIAGIGPGDWTRSGSANGVRLTPLDMLRVLIGHERHHVGVLKERYGLA
jgi:hypothetical protein